MRLTKLKLAGFKSFVDPTHVDLPGQLVGVVGPNGCGKSNIMDAVRWVLGESKASELRGESMQDVIFNGTTQRKPVARAMVELVFDNSLGRASGQWSQYADLSVKRVLTRDGQSDYLINNLKVRRKDITDLFLGTGLGPRAYAIIGQGMITRIIEAKPDELRVFLEEAAGVSKYKERRKETEGRLSDTRENLIRVDDIRQELAGRIEHLDVQAEVARRYHELNNDLTRKQQLLWLAREREADAERARTSLEVEQAITDLEARIAGLREVEARLEESRDAHFSASEMLHKAQAELYEANAEVVRLETELRHQRDLRRSAEARIAQLEGESKEWNEQAARGESDEGRWQELQALADMRVAQGVERLESRQDQLPQAETSHAQAQEQVNRVRADLMRQEQALQVQQTHRTHAERALENLAQRRERLQTDKAALSPPDANVLSDAEQERSIFDEQVAEAEFALESAQEKLDLAQEAKDAAQARQQQMERRHTELFTRRKALAQIQARAEGQGRFDEWLKKQGLDAVLPLWKQIEVEAGWEDAVEAVLRERLKAIAVDDEAKLANVLQNPPQSRLTLLLPPPSIQAENSPDKDTQAADLLLSRLRIASSNSAVQSTLANWLNGIRIVASLQEGLTRRGELATGESFITPAGHRVHRDDVSFFAADAGEHGLLERQRELESLEIEIKAAEEELEQIREQFEVARNGLTDTQEALQGVRRQAQESGRLRHEQELIVLKLTQAVERFNERAVRIDAQLLDLATEEESERERRLLAEEAIGEARESIGQLQRALSDARGAQEVSERRLRDEREAIAQIERELIEARFSQRECAAKLEEIVRNRRLAKSQNERIDNELQECRIRLQDTVPEVLEPKLDEALAARLNREKMLSQARQMLEMATATVVQLDEARLKSEREIEPLRERIGELKLKQQAAALNAEQMAAQLLEAGADTAALESELVNVRPNALQSEIGRLQKAIAELGAVNLAALEELETSRERANYLDNQAADLNQAIETLESAIRRIDKETRELLKHTFDTVNASFGELFPALFGGGRAELVMTGEEILDAGVLVVAQPPGKKNSTIHLLSGGEKALTAIALVFSIFQLNPAPFCLLDEVDAPLDDSNTERFCNMVKKMSAQTQFLFISHNKITMEMAEQLVGVTMQEFGVSRIVEVDMDDALMMRENAPSAAV